MNKEKIAILVDSGSDVPPELLERHHIFMIPLKILFNEGEYLDGLTIDASEVYRRLPFEIPKTSLPDGEQITSILDRIYEEGYRKVLAICISSSLSGTCNMLRLICEEYENLECHVVDSKTYRSAAESLPFVQLSCWKKEWDLRNFAAKQKK